MRRAACVLVERDDGKILCVSRYDNLEDWNLPGGKREPGEIAISNAIRELEEETGLIAYPYDLKKIHSGPCGSDFLADAFLVRYETLRHRSSGPRPSPEGQVAWKDWADILSEKSSFYEYNRELFSKVASA